MLRPFVSNSRLANPRATMGSQSLSGRGGNAPYALALGAADGGNNFSAFAGSLWKTDTPSRGRSYVGRTALV